MARVPDVKAVFEPGDTVKIILTMNRTTMAEIKTWLNDYSSFAGEPLTDVEAIQALLVVGDSSSESMDWRDEVQVEKVSHGYDVCIDRNNVSIDPPTDKGLYLHLTPKE